MTAIESTIRLFCKELLPSLIDETEERDKLPLPLRRRLTAVRSLCTFTVNLLDDINKQVGEAGEGTGEAVREVKRSKGEPTQGDQGSEEPDTLTEEELLLIEAAEIGEEELLLIEAAEAAEAAQDLDMVDIEVDTEQPERGIQKKRRPSKVELLHTPPKRPFPLKEDSADNKVQELLALLDEMIL